MDSFDWFAAGFLAACLLFEIFHVLFLVSDWCLNFVGNFRDRFRNGHASGLGSGGSSFSLLDYSLAHPMRELWLDLKLPNQSEIHKAAGHPKKSRMMRIAGGGRGRQRVHHDWKRHGGMQTLRRSEGIRSTHVPFRKSKSQSGRSFGLVNSVERNAGRQKGDHERNNCKNIVNGHLI